MHKALQCTVSSIGQKIVVGVVADNSHGQTTEANSNTTGIQATAHIWRIVLILLRMISRITGRKQWHRTLFRTTTFIACPHCSTGMETSSLARRTRCEAGFDLKLPAGVFINFILHSVFSPRLQASSSSLRIFVFVLRAVCAIRLI
jgi:hypothetical protein